MGLARDIIFAIFLGAVGGADAFFVAFKIPMFFRRLFAEGAFSQAFVPVLAEYRHTRSKVELKDLVDRTTGVLGGVLLIFTTVVIIAAPLVTALFAPGWYLDEPEKFRMASEMIRVTFPYLLFISLTGLAGAILNSYGRFAIPAFTPVWLNISLISAAIWGSKLFNIPVYALAWGVFFAGLIQLLFQIPFLIKLGMLPRPRFDPKHEGVKRILSLMLPALFGVSVSQINLLLDTVLASFLPSGSVSWLYYSDRVAELPLGIFAIAIATVILPSLSRNYAEKSPEIFSNTIDWAMRMILLISVPATTALVLLTKPILITLFQYRSMEASDIQMISLSMRAYSLGLIAFMLIKVLAPGFYARHDTRTPMKIGIVAMVSNMVLNLFLVIPLHMFWQIGHMGLALATAIAGFINAGLLLRGLLKEKVFHFAPGWPMFLLKLLFANSVMVLLLVFGGTFIEDWLVWGWQGRGWRLALLCGTGGMGYIIALWMMGIRREQLRGPVG